MKTVNKRKNEKLIKLKINTNKIKQIIMNSTKRLNKMSTIEMLAHMAKKIRKGKFTAVETNNMFKVFAEKLLEFSPNYIRHAEIDLGSGFPFIQNNKVLRYENFINIYNNKFEIIIVPHKHGVELLYIEVLKQNKGLGSKLMEFLDLISKQCGIKIYLFPDFQIFSDNNISDEVIRNFFHKNNFKITADSEYWSN
jgi:hypothetical protein